MMQLEMYPINHYHFYHNTNKLSNYLLVICLCFLNPFTNNVSPTGVLHGMKVRETTILFPYLSRSIRWNLKVCVFLEAYRKSSSVA